MHRPADPEVAATLERRRIIFGLIEALRASGAALTADTVKHAMRAAPDHAFKPADYVWVETTLAKRMSDI